MAQHNTIFDAFLEDNPNILFEALRPRGRTARSPFQEEFFRTRGGSIFDEFLGLSGREALEGRASNQSFTNFLQNFDFGRRFSMLSPTQRGGPQRRQFAPRVRFLN